MTVYSTQSSGRDARHALATPHFLPPERTPPFVDEGAKDSRYHGQSLLSPARAPHEMLESHVQFVLLCLELGRLATRPRGCVLLGADALAALWAAKIKTTALPLREALPIILWGVGGLRRCMGAATSRAPRRVGC